MRIERAETQCFDIPLPEALSDSTHGTIRSFAVVTVRLQADNGLAGLGYTYTVGTAGAAAVANLIERDLAPIVRAGDPRRVSAQWDAMWRATHYVGRGGPASFAMSAVDIALWDLKAKALQEPLWRLLGGHDRRVRAYAGGIDLALPLAELERQTRRNVERGFRAIKMKVGRARLREDLERVAAVRKLLGPDLPLMVDANMKWSVPEAIRASRALAEFDVYWLEEPTAPNDVAGHVRIQREGSLPVAAGENLHTLEEFAAMLQAGGAAFPEPDVSNCGGVTVWMKVARLAEALNLPVTSHGVHDLHVSLLAAVPNASFLEVHGFGLERFLKHPLEIADGHAEAPERPGHGVDFDWDALGRHRV